MISSKYGGYFPYINFRENQELMLDKVEEAMKKDNHTVLMIDAPTGSGKTSVIAPIFANKGDKKFIVTVRTNSQIEIYLKEITEICNRTTKKPSIAYIVGKEKLCKLSVSSAICGSLVENTRKLIEYKINELQLKEYNPLLDKNLIEEMERKFDEKPISIEYFIDENENTLLRNENETLICPYYLFSKRGYFIDDKISISNSLEIETKAQEFLSHPLPPDQAKKICKNVCPYECMATAAKNSDVTILMHNHILDESIRSKTYRKLGVNQENVVLLIDEAHNIGEATERNTSEKFDKNLIESAIKQLEDLYSFKWDEIPGKDTFKIIEYLKDNFGFNNVTVDKKIEDFKNIIISTENKSLSFRLNNDETKANLIIDDFTTDEFLVNKRNVLLKVFKNIDSKNEAFNKNNTSELLYKVLLKLKNILDKDGNEHYFTPELLNNNLFNNLEQNAQISVVDKSLTYAKLLNDIDNSEFNEVQPLGKVAALLSIINHFNNNDQYILRIGKDETNKKNIILELINLDPSSTLSKIADSHSTTIMMSGTFSPIELYELYYFGKKGRAEIHSVPNSFPSQNRLIIGINDVSTISANRDDKTNYKKCIDMFITDIPGNIALFFTSYQMKRDYSTDCNDITKKNKKEFFDQENGIADEIFEKFKNAGKNKGGVLIALCGGTLSEGKDYRGDALKGAMMIGLPLGPRGTFQEMKDEYYIGRYGVNNGDFIAYRLPAMNKALQALGRVIRDRDETGILILADSRFTKEDKYSVRQYLPSWIKNEMILCNSLQIGDIIRNWIKNTKSRETQSERDDRIVNNSSFLKNTTIKYTKIQTNPLPIKGGSGIGNLFCPKCKSMMLMKKCRKCGYKY
ncbi:MAG: helicase C-terminal domain-containing protein [Candidatus Methanoperedens sp.]